MKEQLSQNTNIPENTQNSKDNNKEQPISTIEINGIPIEVKKYYFEYPERIQKETGILGYERMLIKKEELEKFPKKSNQRILSETILSSLTNGEYPAKTLNHQMGYYSNASYSEKYSQQFVDDKFFIQKIYGIETGKKIKNQEIPIEETENKRDALFSHSALMYRDGSTFFSVFKKRTNEFVKEITPDQITDYDNQDDVYLSSAGSGLNTTVNLSFYNSRDSNAMYKPNIFSDNPSFGFYPDNWFSKYIEKTIKKYIEINNSNESTIIDQSGLAELCWIMDLPNLIDLINREGRLDLDYKKNTQYFENLHEKYKHILTYKSSENTKKDGAFYSNEGFPRIPIFINSDDILQLRWGNAKYAHFMSSNGFNLIKFKHTDHLPEPKK